jgi:hypothetical protein
MALQARNTFPTLALRQCESAVIEHPPAAIWRYLRVLALHRIAPHSVRSVEWALGSEDDVKVGSVATVTYADADVWRLRVTAMAEERLMEFEAVETEPPTDCVAITGAFRLHRVTETGHTFVEWESAHHFDCARAGAAEPDLVERQRQSKLAVFECLRMRLV